MSVLTEDQQRQSPWRIRGRENEMSDGYRFKFRLYCLLIFNTLQEHVGFLLSHHQDIPLALPIISLPGWKDSCQEVLFKACNQHLNLNNKHSHHIVHSDQGNENFKAD